MYSDNKQIRDVADVAARIMSGQQPVSEKLHPNQQKLDVHEPEKDKLTADDFKKLRAGKKDDVKKEEVEELDELSKDTLKSYYKGSVESGMKAQHRATNTSMGGSDSEHKKNITDINKRVSGQDSVTKRLGSKETMSMDKEAGVSRLAKYKPTKPNPKKYSEEVEQVEEGRASQRHPLEGHEYHKKSDEALIHIAKDAHAAAEAMKGHNTDAENKYRDQANDSATVRHFRKTSGTPDWYKKKYGLKESFRPMDEPNYNNSIQARQKKADDANKPPFDGPYKKTPTVVTDKSGAKHGPMSRARDLARNAAKKQAGSMKEEKQKSRKAQIIKDASRGKDKFEKDPIITDTTVKTDNLQ